MLRRVSIQVSISLIVGGLFLYRGHVVAGPAILLVGMLLASTAAFAPDAYRTLDGLVSRLGAWIATAIGAVLLTIVYLSVFALGALYLRARSKDPLNRSFPPTASSNWVLRTGRIDRVTYSKQFSRPHSASSESAPAE